MPYFTAEILCPVHRSIQEALHSKMNPRRVSAGGVKSTQSEDDTDEIVIVSDTVRQRRSRTPSSNTESNTTTVTANDPLKSTIVGSTMPDLLPDTFRLAESSALFSQVSDGDYKLPEGSPTPHYQRPLDQTHRVEIRESDLSATRHVSMSNPSPTSGHSMSSARVNTISILESVDTFEPEFVEMVHIVDASEDDEIEEEPITDKSYSVKERDLLRDSEDQVESPKVREVTKRRSLIPNLKEILCAPMGRDSYSGSEKDTDEPLVFYEGEAVPRHSCELTECPDSVASNTVCLSGSI